MNGRRLFYYFGFLANVFSLIMKIFPLKIRICLFSGERYSQGYYGLAIRYILLKSIAKKIGRNVAIEEGCFILNPQNLVVGDNVSINQMCYIECYGGVEIGSDVSIAHGTTIMSVTHNYDRHDEPIKYQGTTPLKVIIKDNIWIGAKCTILGGVLVDSGAIVGANALVNKYVSPNTIVGGVPAKFLKNR